MSNILVNLLVYVYSAILRGTDSRTKRYVIFNKDATFGKDLCDFIATMENIRANFKIGTVQSSTGDVFNVKDYPILTGFLNYLRLGEVYFNEACKEKARPVFKAVWESSAYVNIVRAFFNKGNYLPGLFHSVKEKDGNGNDVEKKVFNYNCEIMSPNRMIEFFKDLKIEDDKYSLSTLITPSILQEMDTVSDDKGRMFLIGGEISSEWSFLSGVTIPENITGYLRVVPEPTEEEIVSCLTKVMF